MRVRGWRYAQSVSDECSLTSLAADSYKESYAVSLSGCRGEVEQKGEEVLWDRGVYGKASR